MKVSSFGLALLRQIEGVEHDAYLDSAGIWTIGVGHTFGVKEGDHIDDAQIDAYLKADLREAEENVHRLVTVPLNQHQFDALALFVFNIGWPAFEESTMLRKLNAGDFKGAAAQFPRWKYAGGGVVRGLVNRRKAEQRVFLTGLYRFDSR